MKYKLLSLNEYLRSNVNFVGLDSNQTTQLLIGRRVGGTKREMDGFRIDGSDGDVAFIKQVVAHAEDKGDTRQS